MSDTEKVLELIDEALEPADFPGFHPEADGWDDDAAEGARAWQIDGERTAAWAMGRVSYHQRRIAEAQVLAGDLRRRADEYEAEAIARAQPHLDYFAGKLREFYEAEKPNLGRTKTRPVLGGKLAEAVGSVTTELVGDTKEAKAESEAALVSWLEDHNPALVNYPAASADKGEVKKLYGGKVDKTEAGDYPAVDPASGDEIPGVIFRRKAPKFTVTDEASGAVVEVAAIPPRPERADDDDDEQEATDDANV